MKGFYQGTFPTLFGNLLQNGGDGGDNNIRMPPRGGGGGDGDGDGSSGDDKVLGLTARALYSRYQGLLSRAPLVTKSVSAGLITLLGDVIAQWLESRIEGYYGWNVVRMAAFTVAGGFFVGPFVHYWYEVLWAVGRRLPANTPSKLTTLLQVFLDQTIGVALFFPAYFYVYEACEVRIPAPASCLLDHPSYPLTPSNALRFSRRPRPYSPSVGPCPRWQPQRSERTSARSW
jgi:hypothetical protein